MQKIYRLDMTFKSLRHSFYFDNEEQANLFAGVMDTFFNNEMPKNLKMKNLPQGKVKFSGKSCELIQNKEDAEKEFDRMRNSMMAAAESLMGDMMSKMKTTKRTDVN